MSNGHKNTWISWSAIGVLAILCGAVAVLQYRWIGEISQAEQQRLRDDLRDQLEDVRRHFNDQVAGATMELRPQPDEIQRLGVRAAYEEKYQGWKAANGAMFTRIALAEVHAGKLNFYILNPQTGTFVSSDVPAEWAELRNRLEALAQQRPPDAPAGPGDTLLEWPVFERPLPDAPPEPAWIILELNLDYVREKLLPESLERSLASGGKLDYQVEVVARADLSRVIYRRGELFRAEDEDGEVALLDEAGEPRLLSARPRPEGALPPPGAGEPRVFKKGPPQDRPEREDRGKRDRAKQAFFGDPPRDGQARPEPGGPGGGPGRWLLRVQHRAGSLEVLVAQTRRRNLAVSAGLLALILATSLVLVRYTRRMRELAELQMNFVAGVSHELRTPLTVIRSAAFNLSRGQSQSGAQGQERIEQYGTLIEDESKKLSVLVDQVLQFGGSSNGQIARQSTPVPVEALIDEALEASQPAVAAPGIAIEKHIAADLPPILGDRVALRHALQNLIENAVKYGTIPQNWIGISASPVCVKGKSGKGGRCIEIRISDRGSGIPHDEQGRIFEPFFRGQRAIDDQIHGTGLGLNLVKKIIEAHAGRIRLESEPGQGATFVMQLPAAPESTVHEFTNPVG